MKSQQNPTAAQLAYEYAIVDKKLARANENLKGVTIEQLRAMKADAIRAGKWQKTYNESINTSSKNRRANEILAKVGLPKVEKL